MKKIKISDLKHVSIWLLILTFACSKKSEPGFQFPADTYIVQKVYDVGNSGNSSDIRVQLTFNASVPTDKIGEVRGLLVKNSKVLLATDAANVSVGDYFSIPAGTTGALKLPANISDSDGDAIKNDASYNLMIAVIGKDKNPYLSAAKNFSLSNRPVYAGDYTGKWTDPILGTIGLSVRINDNYTGSIFYSANFSPCCGGSEDGLLNMTVNGAVIVDFEYSQYLGSYKGGHCTTSVAAMGKFVDDITLSLDPFPFADCDGSRTVSKFEVTR